MPTPVSTGNRFSKLQLYLKIIYAQINLIQLKRMSHEFFNASQFTSDHERGTKYRHIQC